MPVHDWTRVSAGVFHGFHGRWITGLTITLNRGVLPPGFYADGEQITHTLDPDERTIPDLLTLKESSNLFAPGGNAPGVGVAEAPPRTRHRVTVTPVVPPRRHLVIRHETGDRVVALVEIVSPANKDRAGRVRDFVAKVADAIGAGVHVLILDLFAPGRHDPHGVHGAVADELGGPAYSPSDAEPLSFASYDAGPPVEAFVEPLAVGAALPEMPLFLTPGRYVTVPLQPAYDLAWSGTADKNQAVLEGPSKGPTER